MVFLGILFSGGRLARQKTEADKFLGAPGSGLKLAKDARAVHMAALRDSSGHPAKHNVSSIVAGMPPIHIPCGR
jgi:hypothetical protein